MPHRVRPAPRLPRPTSTRESGAARASAMCRHQAEGREWTPVRGSGPRVADREPLTESNGDDFPADGHRPPTPTGLGQPPGPPGRTTTSPPLPAWMMGSTGSVQTRNSLGRRRRSWPIRRGQQGTGPHHGGRRQPLHAPEDGRNANNWVSVQGRSRAPTLAEPVLGFTGSRSWRRSDPVVGPQFGCPVAIANHESLAEGRQPGSKPP
jgi:hypothetical protein